MPRATVSFALGLFASALVLGSGPLLSRADPTPEEQSRKSADASFLAIASRDRARARGGNRTAQEPTGPRAPGSVEELTVYAERERKEEEAARPAESVNGRTLRELNVPRIDEIGGTFANLQFDQAAGTANSARITLRGVGSEDPSDQLSVGTTFNGVPLQRGDDSLVRFGDIDRIDVQAGPGAVVGGRDTVGGNINIVLRKPTFDFNGDASVRIGNFDLLETSAMLNVPLVPEKLAARFGFTTSERDGYAKNRFVGGGSTADERSTVSGRAALLWNATDSLELLFSATASKDKGAGSARKCKFVGLRSAPGRPAPAESSAQRRQGVISSSPDAPTTREERDAALKLSREAALSGGEFAEACREDEEHDIRSVSSDARLQDDVFRTNTSLVATWSPTATWQLRSTTGWVSSESNRSSDGDATGLPLQGDFRGGKNRGKNSSLTEELMLSGSGLSGKLRLNLGVFGSMDHNRGNGRDQAFSGTSVRPAFLRAQGTNAEENARSAAEIAADPGLTDPALRVLLMGDPDFTTKMVDGFPLAIGFGECVQFPEDNPADLRVTCLRPFQTPRTQSASKSDTTTYSAFASGSYSITRALILSGSLRFNQERRRTRSFDETLDLLGFADQSDPQTQPFGIDGNPANGGRFVPISLFEAGGVNRRSDSVDRTERLTPRLSLQYFFQPNMNASFTVSRGERPGRATRDGRRGPPEVTMQYELGLRSSWFRRRLTANLTVFQIRQSDLQRTLGGAGAMPAAGGGQRAAGAAGAMLGTGGAMGAGAMLGAGGAMGAGAMLAGGGATGAGAMPAGGGDDAANGVIYGGNATITFTPSRRLQLSANTGIMSARYTALSPAQLRFKGQPFPNTPNYTFNFSANYSLPLGSLGDLRTRLNWRQVGEKASDSFNNPLTRTPKFGTLSGNLLLDLADGATSISLFGNNLFDREYITNAIDLTTSNGTVQRFFAPPRTFGLEIRRRF